MFFEEYIFFLLNIFIAFRYWYNITYTPVGTGSKTGD